MKQRRILLFAKNKNRSERSREDTPMDRSIADLFDSGQPQFALDEILHEGAQALLKKALIAEVDAYLEAKTDVRDEQGRRQVVRNGYLPERQISTQVGRLSVKQPRVRDKRGKEGEAFESSILPRYMRRSPKLDELIPWLYLKGISTGEMLPALEALVGKSSKGFSASTIVRLKEHWTREFQSWNQRDLSAKEYVYFWADGIHFNIRLEEDRQCILVLIGATKDGKKELIAVLDGYRESAQSWRELLLDVKHRGLEIPPRLAVGDGALGFWKAMAEIYPATREQRCWVHKTANLLNKFPKHLQPKAKEAIHEIWQAETRGHAVAAYDEFIAKYGDKYPKAVECLVKDRDALLAFYDFPAAHWKHLRTTNAIESTFATVRLRHRRTKGSGSRVACLAMVFKLLQAAERRWRRLNGHKLLGKVIEGVKFVDGIEDIKQAS